MEKWEPVFRRNDAAIGSGAGGLTAWACSRTGLTSTLFARQPWHGDCHATGSFAAYPFIRVSDMMDLHRQATILIVDDDALINIGTADMVQDMGLRALEAYSGREALDILERGDAVDVLITDFAMPGMNGLELAGRARQLRPSLPVLLATGYDELPGGEVTDLPRLGKPFQQAELLACLERALAVGHEHAVETQ